MEGPKKSIPVAAHSCPLAPVGILDMKTLFDKLIRGPTIGHFMLDSYRFVATIPG